MKNTSNFDINVNIVLILSLISMVHSYNKFLEDWEIYMNYWYIVQCFKSDFTHYVKCLHQNKWKLICNHHNQIMIFSNWILTNNYKAVKPVESGQTGWEWSNWLKIVKPREDFLPFPGHLAPKMFIKWSNRYIKWSNRFIKW